GKQGGFVGIAWTPEDCPTIPDVSHRLAPGIRVWPGSLRSSMHFDLQGFIIAFGYLRVLAFVFAESGLFFGFFLPGDSLPFTAGLLASAASRRLWETAGTHT